MYNPKDPENSAGRLYSWLCVNEARLIGEEQYYDRFDDCLRFCFVALGKG